MAALDVLPKLTDDVMARIKEAVAYSTRLAGTRRGSGPLLELGPMDAIVIYESLTGNTRKAGEAIAGQLTAAGVPTVACPITAVASGALSRAEQVVVGSWVAGFLVVGQRPGRTGRIETMPARAGQTAAL